MNAVFVTLVQLIMSSPEIFADPPTHNKKILRRYFFCVYHDNHSDITGIRLHTVHKIVRNGYIRGSDLR